MDAYSTKRMNVYVIIVLSMCFVTSTWESDGLGRTNGYLACLCEPTGLLENFLHGKIAEMWYNHLYLSISLNSMKEPIFSGEENCTVCGMVYRTCFPIVETQAWDCKEKRITFKVLPKTENASSWTISTKVFVKESGLMFPMTNGYDNDEMSKEEFESYQHYIMDVPKGEDDNRIGYVTGRAERIEEYANLTSTDSKGHKRVRRYRRPRAPCRYPRILATASLECLSYPSNIKCIQKCLWGYTLPGGIRQEFKCNTKENKWRPHAFRECEPFVDCGTGLYRRIPGEVNCTTITLTEGPTCTIKCYDHEIYKKVPEDTYTCDINGKWSKPLPYCAMNGSALILTKAPDIKIHEYAGFEIEDPEGQ